MNVWMDFKLRLEGHNLMERLESMTIRLEYCWINSFLRLSTALGAPVDRFSSSVDSTGCSCRQVLTGRGLGVREIVSYQWLSTGDTGAIDRHSCPEHSTYEKTPPPAAAWAYDDEHEVGQLLVISHATPASTMPNTTTSTPTTPTVATLTSPLYNNPVIPPIIPSPLNISFSPALAPLLATPSIIDTTSPPLHHNLALRSGRMFHQMYPNTSVSMLGQPTQTSNNQQQQQDTKEIDPEDNIVQSPVAEAEDQDLEDLILAISHLFNEDSISYSPAMEQPVSAATTKRQLLGPGEDFEIVNPINPTKEFWPGLLAEGQIGVNPIDVDVVSVSTPWTPTLIPTSNDVDANFSDLHALQSQKFWRQGNSPIGELSPNGLRAILSPHVWERGLSSSKKPHFATLGPSLPFCKGGRREEKKPYFLTEENAHLCKPKTLFRGSAATRSLLDHRGRLPRPRLAVETAQEPRVKRF
ncbi:hypothetical protein Taro_053252 [Colocasia esculenta]|uniref:Uncharacterized protein n=1 Tax=Colocasia esculenta TaxID=4460 RepID=A0A843XMH7_COLES|nr:hypothetical protein [Colocasia esculenta]